MELQPFGPLEQAMTASTLPISASQNTGTSGILWGLFAGLIFGG
jgi:hypothetical protein